MTGRLAFTVFLVLMAHSVTGRSLRGMVSDGMHEVGWRGPGLGLRSTSVTCTPTYGILPCTTELWGELFLVIVYEYLLGVAQHYISSGSDLFFQMFGTGIFGASLFQMLGTVPQVIIMLVSALSSSSDTIESMAAMGLSMLAGSVIMTFTLIWGSIIVFGSHDLSESSSTSTPTTTSTPTATSTSTPTATTSTSTSTSTLTSPSSSFTLPTLKQVFSSSYGVETDTDTKKVAGLILISMIPFLILQLAKVLSSSTAERIVVLISLIVAVVFLIIYCTYEVFQPWIQEKRYEFLLQKKFPEGQLKKCLTTAGKPDEERIKELFRRIDKNNNGVLSETELSAFLLGIQLEEEGLSTGDFTERLMKNFDHSQDNQLSKDEFIQGMKSWLGESTTSSAATTKKPSNSTSQGSTEEQQSLISHDTNTTTTTTTGSAATTSTTKPQGKAWVNYTKAFCLIILGTGITVLIGQPLMINIQGFATATGIPSFFVSYVVVPLAMGYKQVIMGVTAARKMTEKGISLSLSEIYNGMFMSNVMGLATFLAIVYIVDISWDVSAEILLVLLICTLMGCLTSLLTKFPLWMGILAYILYPISLLLLYVLTEVLGWA